MANEVLKISAQSKLRFSLFTSCEDYVKVYNNKRYTQEQKLFVAKAIEKKICKLATQIKLNDDLDVKENG